MRSYPMSSWRVWRIAIIYFIAFGPIAPPVKGECRAARALLDGCEHEAVVRGRDASECAAHRVRERSVSAGNDGTSVRGFGGNEVVTDDDGALRERRGRTVGADPAERASGHVGRGEAD